MFENRVSYRNGSERFLARYGEQVLALLFVVGLALFTTSCGTVAQANGSGNSLALTGSLPSGAVDQPYNAVLAVGGGSSPYQFSVHSGSLPAGVNLNPSTGSFTGTPTTSGTYSFQVLVTDQPLSDQGVHDYSVTVSGNGSGVKVSVSPSSVTIPSGGKQQFTASVTGTADTRVIWSATIGSMNQNGLYTAPVVQATTTATITATSRADSSKSATAIVTIQSNQGGPLQITTTGLPQAFQGEPYTASFTASGGTAPYSWSLTGGKLPPGITLGTGGSLSGTPTKVGTFNFTVQVTDAASKTANGNFGITVSSSSGFDGPAQLPVVTVPVAMSDSPAPGSVVFVNAGDDLQAAFNKAQCGQTIELQAGATFAGDFTLPAKNCDADHWIIVRTSAQDSALPSETQRLTPCYGGVASLQGRPAYDCSHPKNVLAKIEMNKGGDGPIQFEDKANFYRLIGLEITRQDGMRGDARLVSLNGTADHIILDRLWEHGQPQDETKNGFQAGGGTYIAVINSYFNDLKCISGTGACTDAHAVSGGTSDTQDGPYLIRNNYLEASGEGVLFGGGAATKTPTDITVQYNHFYKPWQWMPGNKPFVGGKDGHAFIVKNHLELKNAVRVLIENNLMENSWGGFSQNGYSLLLTPANQHTRSGKNVCPDCQVTDITIRYNRMSHAGAGIQFANPISPNREEGKQALMGTRYSLHDLVIDDLSKNYTGGGSGFALNNSWPKNPLNTITINHVTVFPDPDAHLIITGNLDTNPSMYGFVFTNNMALTAAHPVWNSFGSKDSCSADDVPVTSLNKCFADLNFTNNALIATPKAFPPSDWPSQNMFPATVQDVDFTNYNQGNGGNYQLLSKSPYKNKGTDGKDLGADIPGLNAALAGVE